ncbi:Fic family protein [Paenibacillus oceani]|uniref:Fic family protein n=1 Tax=Paenibacillus oceani TaxID=2772510 RepID=A0A927C6F0_9BACL|nr:Fic family protein [Paenibacillus oceani]MBD2860411.1 Fic family protein [Paenibacillus oceani]
MAAIKGVKKLPVSVNSRQAAELFMKLANISSEIGRLDEKFRRSILKSDLINTLALKESVQSTRIEGTQVTFTDMIEHSHKSEQKSEHIEVLNYQRALTVGQERILNGYPLTTRLILELHTTLMDGPARGTNIASGEFRKVPNWIGPTKRFEDAAYIPVPANEIEEYMNNWELFANKHPYGEKLETSHLPQEAFILDEDTHPLLKVAILHAQFESIHPFLDGNGRLGRILIALFMMQSKQISSPIFFVSEELEKQRSRYYHLLNETRGDNPNWFNWLNFFLDASKRMADKLNILLDNAEGLALNGLKKCDTHNQKQIYLLTFRYPNITANQVSEQFRIAPLTARRILNSLNELGLIFKDPAQKRNIEYFNYDLLDLLDH